MRCLSGGSVVRFCSRPVSRETAAFLGLANMLLPARFPMVGRVRSTSRNHRLIMVRSRGSRFYVRDSRFEVRMHRPRCLVCPAPRPQRPRTLLPPLSPLPHHARTLTHAVPPGSLSLGRDMVLALKTRPLLHPIFQLSHLLLLLSSPPQGDSTTPRCKAKTRFGTLTSDRPFWVAPCSCRQAIGCGTARPVSRPAFVVDFFFFIFSG